MQTHDLQQGSPAWHEFRATHFGASEAPAMLGISPYKTRSQLLHEKATGIVPDVDVGTQSRFDDGHRFEALARPLAEKIIGQELSPVTISEGNLSASLDGITFDDTVIWEHKTLSNGLEQIIERGQPLPDMYLAQMEQQLMLSGAEKCLFQASRWNGDTLVKEMHQWYTSDPLLRERIRIGWAAFHRDLETYVPPEVVQPVVAEAVIALPALFVQIKGEVTTSNLPVFVEAADAFLSRIKTVLKTDQDFADAEANVKACDTAEKGIEQAKNAITAQAADIDTIMRTMDLYKDKLRDVRLKLKKLVETEKDARKLAILQEAKNAYARHTGALHEEIKPITLQIPYPDFAGAMKGLKKLSAMQEAVDNALRDGKMLADAAAKDIRTKRMWISGEWDEYEFLFSDLQQIIIKPMDDFKLLVTTRIDKHKADEAAKIECIRAEEKAKAEAAAKAKVEAEARAMVEQEAIAKANEFMPTVPTMAEDRAAAIEERRKQAQIAEQSKPFNGVPAKPIRPDDYDLITTLMHHYGVSEGMVKDWILEVAENLRVVA